jgi:Lactonase, 7-bladed beta-propeller
MNPQPCCSWLTGGGRPRPCTPDNAVSSDGRALYVLNRSADELAEFSVGADTHLTAVGTQAVPAGPAGVAAS